MPLIPNDSDDDKETAWLACVSLVFLVVLLGIAIYVIVTTGSR